MRKNQHGWKKWVSDDRTRKVLEEAANGFESAWKQDKRYPKSYPLSTSYLFFQITQAIQNKSIAQTGLKAPPMSPPPESLAELIDDKIIGSVYEQQNAGSYKDALKQAAAGHGKGASAWRTIVRSINDAYAITYYGVEHIPKPRVQFLHRKFLELSNHAKLNDLTNEGLAEFLDDICPCGKKHTSEEIRKLRKRWSRARSKP